MFNNKLPIFILFVLLAVPSLSFADTPLTSTNFYKAYLDVPIVKVANDTNKLNEVVADYLLDNKKPFDVKVAVINALSWDENVRENVRSFVKFLKRKYGENFLDSYVDEGNQEELILMFYLMALSRYDRPSDIVSYMMTVQRSLSTSFTAAIITALTKAQLVHLLYQDAFIDMAKDYALKIYKNPKNSNLTKTEIESLALEQALGGEQVSTEMSNYGCTEWLIIEEVLNDDSLEMDMRPSAKDLIVGYMRSYEKYCEGIEEYWKVSPTRG